MLKLDGNSLTLEKIEYFLKDNPEVILTPDVKKRVQKARTLIEKWVEKDEPIYGVTTGFGEFSNVKISRMKILNFFRRI